MEAIQGLATHMDDRFNEVNQCFQRVDKRFEQVEKRFDYIERKIDDLRGDLVSMLRQGNEKFKRTVDKLRQRKMLTRNDTDEVLSMKPFPTV